MMKVGVPSLRELTDYYEKKFIQESQSGLSRIYPLGPSVWQCLLYMVAVLFDRSLPGPGC